MPGHVDLVADDVVDTKEQVAHRDVLLHGVRGAIDPALPVSREAERRLAERLARDRAGVDAHAADDRALLDNRDPLVELRALDGGPMSGWTRADDEQIVVVLRHRPHLKGDSARS